MGFDLRIPLTQPNPGWYGTVELFIDAPSIGVNNQPLGVHSLNAWTPGQWRRAEFSVPTAIRTALGNNYQDLRWRIQLNVPPNSLGQYLFDRFTWSSIGGCVPTDDGNPCTIDQCDANGQPEHVPAPAGTACSDANVCNGSEVCDATGTCVAGTPLPVDDGNPCTADSCDPVAGVSHAPAPAGTSCANADACDGTETCNATGICTAGTPVVCTALDQCHDAGTCSPGTGACSNPSKPNGTSCSDGSACTQADTCQAGTCTGSNAVVCVALDQCHDAGTCDPGTGACSNPSKPDGTSCSDGSACTQADACQAGTCTGSDPVVCVALDECHDEGTCNPGTGACSNPPKPNGTACSDGNGCTQADTCQAGTCTAGAPTICAALDQCHLAGTCDPASGACSNPTKPDGAACSDSDACTQTDSCQTGTCTGANPVVCVASDSCHASGTCNPTSGTCTDPTLPDGTPCNDATVCNGSETCTTGTCTAGTPPVIDDGNPCTADACDPATGVTNIPVPTGTSCANATLCDGAETCDASGTCTAGTPPAIDDGNPCTVDTCDPVQGVLHAPALAGTQCADANACNGAETCDATGTCVAGTPPTVSDGNPCTEDSCDPVLGTVHTPVVAGTDCSDFDQCNGAELCDAAGVCQPGAPVVIDTSNPCQVGTCDPVSGVVTYAPAPEGTECFVDTCTIGECNASGMCSSTGSVVVDDGDPCTIEWCDPELGPQMTACSVLDRTVGTTLYESMKWLFSGPNPPQVGVAPGTIVVERAVFVRGLVENREGDPLPGVTVSILGHPEFGYTLTHVDGRFDMVINGGGTIVVEYEREGYLDVQRNVATNWGDYATLPDVVMIQPDPVVTTIDLTAPTSEIQVAQASIQSDADGVRQGTLLVPGGTVATMHHADGSTEELSTMAVRITEFTVGEKGERAMPGPLPGESKYTHAFEINADEAVAADAPEVTFSTPLVYYVDNFLYFQAGTTVPLGSFDRAAGAWTAEESGVVLDIVGHTGALADIDITGEGEADPPSALAAHGITEAERLTLAGLYEPGRTLWRLSVPHFTRPWDANWGGGPPPDAEGPEGDGPEPDEPPPCKGGGGIANASFIECEGQVLKEAIPVAGTPYTLNYSSLRVPGRTASNRLVIPLSGATVPASLLRINLSVNVAGRTKVEEFPPLANQSATFVWDGFDSFGRQLQGAQQATVKVAYAYEYTYTRTSRFGYNGNGLEVTTATGVVPPPPGGFPARTCGTLATLASSVGTCDTASARTRLEISLARDYSVFIGGFDARAHGLGGWTLSAQHAHELAAQRLELGTGDRIDASVVSPVVNRRAQAASAEGTTKIGKALAVAPDGSVFSAGSNTVWRTPSGQITPVRFAGNESSAYGGDGLPATHPSVGFSVWDIAVGRDGSVYIADSSNQIIRKIGPDGIIDTIAGIPGVRDLGAPEGLATETPLGDPQFLTVAPDDTLYISTPYNVMRVGTDGMMTRIAGNVVSFPIESGNPSPPDGVVATSLRLEPRGLGLSPDGTLFAVVTGGNGSFSDTIGTAIIKLVDGVVYRVAGGCLTGCTTWTDGAFARSPTVRIRPTGLAFDKLGALYFSDITGDSTGTYSRFATITPEGVLLTVAGKASHDGSLPVHGDPAIGTNFEGSSFDGTLAVGPNGLHVVSNIGSPIVFRIGLPLPSDTGASSIVAARGDDAFYSFDSLGRHMLTQHSLTGANLSKLDYDSSGKLSAITDEAGKVTTIERNANGDPLAIVGPFGQRTELELGADGYLSTVTDPEGMDTKMTYYPGGLLQTFTNARGLVSTMQFDALGRLEKDTDAAGGTHTLVRTEAGPDWTVTRSTAMDRTTVYTATRDPGLRRSQVMTTPSGDDSAIERGPDQVTRSTLPDGTIVSIAEKPDTRFGLNAPLITRTTRLPSGLTSTESTQRSYAFLSSTNFLDFHTRNDERNVNGRTWFSSYTKAERTFDTSSPEGRSSSRIIDTLGRTVSTHVESLAPISFQYDSSGRVFRTVHGTPQSQGSCRLS